MVMTKDKLKKNLKWVCKGLTDLLQSEIPDETAEYVWNMGSEDEIREYLSGLLPVDNPKKNIFIDEFIARKKFNESDLIEKGNHSHQPFSQSKVQETCGVKPQQNDKQKHKVEIKSEENVLIPGRRKCDCMATAHPLINNCQSCGKIVCAQEGSGSCLFCGNLVVTNEEAKILSTAGKQCQKLKQKLKVEDGVTSTCNLQDIRLIDTPTSQQQTKRALAHRNKLLEFDKTTAQRTKVFDDQSDYYQTDGNAWVSKDEKEKLAQIREVMQDKKHSKKRSIKVKINLDGGKIEELNSDEDGDESNISDGLFATIESGNEMSFQNFASLMADNGVLNPTIKTAAPTFIPSKVSTMMINSSKKMKEMSLQNSKVQDDQLLIMSDLGMCLSMHQPYASLLVAGIKLHEGRTWYSNHRGRLWIAATAQTPDDHDISRLEEFYESKSTKHIHLPQAYPTGCLLGCVEVSACLDQTEYRRQFPDGDSESPFVFICDNPIELPIKFEVKGQHKIYKLDSNLFDAARKSICSC